MQDRADRHRFPGRSGFTGNGSPANAKPPRCGGADPPGVRGLRHLRGDHRPRQLLVPRSHPGYSLTPRPGAAPSAGSGSPEEFMPRLRQMAEEAARDPQSLAGRIEAKPAPEPGFARERPLAA